MARKRFLTTGEASKLLDLSRSTISRMFDQGTLTGKRHPITGKRIISAEAVGALLNHYDMPGRRGAIQEKGVLACAFEKPTQSLVEKAFHTEPRVHLQSTSFGSDALVLFSKSQPDLVILDDPLSDIPVAEVARSLRRVGVGKEFKVLLISDRSDFGKEELAAVDECLQRKTLDAACLLAKALAMLGLPQTPPDAEKPFKHERSSARMTLRIPARIELFRPNVPRERIAGRAILQNISMGGAFLTNIELETRRLPVSPFKLLLLVDGPPLENWQAHCHVARFQMKDTLSAAVTFSRISRDNLKKISALTGQ